MPPLPRCARTPPRPYSFNICTGCGSGSASSRSLILPLLPPLAPPLPSLAARAWADGFTTAFGAVSASASFGAPTRIPPRPRLALLLRLLSTRSSSSSSCQQVHRHSRRCPHENRFQEVHSDLHGRMRQYTSAAACCTRPFLWHAGTLQPSRKLAVSVLCRVSILLTSTYLSCFHLGSSDHSFFFGRCGSSSSPSPFSFTSVRSSCR